MNRKVAIIVILLSTIQIKASAQNVNYKQNIDLLTGKWYLVNQNSNNQNLLFEKAEINKMRWGDYIQFMANGEFIVGHSAMCGNDTSIFRNYGNWTYDSNTKRIITSISIHKKGRKFKIKLITDIKMNLE